MVGLSKCPLCDGGLVRKKEHDKDLDQDFDFDECVSCGEKFYFYDVMVAIDKWRSGHGR